MVYSIAMDYLERHTLPQVYGCMGILVRYKDSDHCILSRWDICGVWLM